jgi:hypothetical protein
MKMGPDDLGIAENESGSEKIEKGTRRPRYRRKCVWARKTRKRDVKPSVQPKTTPGAQNMKTSLGAQNMKTGPDVLGTAENESGRAKHE